MRAIDERKAKLVHNGQHYCVMIPGVFREDLMISRPNVDLGVGSASHAVQTAKIMIRKFSPLLEPCLIDIQGLFAVTDSRLEVGGRWLARI